MAGILIVDDSKFMRNIIKEALESGGHTVLGEAENGNEALEKFKLLSPDIVTMDVTMWGKDGISAVDEIVQLNPSAKVIMVSALNEATMKSNKKNIQASAFLTKPFSKDQLLDIVNSLI